MPLTSLAFSNIHVTQTKPLGVIKRSQPQAEGQRSDITMYSGCGRAWKRSSVTKKLAQTKMACARHRPGAGDCSRSIHSGLDWILRCVQNKTVAALTCSACLVVGKSAFLLESLQMTSSVEWSGTCTILASRFSLLACLGVAPAKLCSYVDGQCGGGRMRRVTNASARWAAMGWRRD